MRAELHVGDGLEVMRGMPDASVDLLASDPPYNVTALAFDRQPVDWAAWWAEARRVVKPTGLVVLFAQQPFTTDLINSNRREFRYLLVWEKSLRTGFLDANRRPLRAHEDVLVFTQRFKGSTYNPQKVDVGEKWYRGSTRPPQAHYGQAQPAGPTVSADTTRYPITVLKFANPNNGNLHPTQKPLDLMRWIVASYSNPGDLVLDPFAGSGTTLEACAQLGRQYVGVELEPAYHAVAWERLNPKQPALLAAP